MKIDSLFLNQIFFTIAFILVTILSLTILYDAYLKFQKKEGLYTNEEAEKIIRITRIITLIIVILFFINTYEGTKVAKELDRYNYNLKIQLISSIITIIPEILSVYVAFSSENEFVQSFNSET